MLTADEVRALSVPSAARAVLALIVDWVGIAAIFFVLARYPNPWLWFVAVLLMGRQQLALAIVMHDAAHWRLFKNRKVNDYVAQIFAAAPVFFSLYTYRKTHLKHHKAPLAPDDPDLRLIGGYPIKKASFARKLARDALGISYFKFIFHFAKISSTQKKQRPKNRDAEQRSNEWKMRGWQVLGSVIFIHASIAGALIATHHAWMFFAVWLLPFATTTQLYLRIRGIAEHAGYAANADQRFASRTVVNAWQTFFVAPHLVNYHIEHHVYPSIPWFNLPRAHALMKARGALPEANVFDGYAPVVKSLVV